MNSPSEPPSGPRSEQSDPVVSRFAERVRSSLPAARALVPLSAEARRALADKLLGEEREELEAPADEPGAAPTHTAPAANDVSPRARNASPRRAPRWWPLALAAAFVLAAVVWIVIRPSSPAPLAYHLHIEGDAIVRGDTPAPPDAPLRLRPSTRLLVVLTPPAPIQDATLRMLVVHDGKARLVRPSFESDGQGKITIDKPAREALGDQVNGAAELVWIAGRPMPEDAEIERIALDAAAIPPAGTAVLRRSVVFEDWGGAALSPLDDVELGGCKAMTRGARCEMEAGGALVLWAPLLAGEVDVQIDGQPASVRTEGTASGTRWTVTVPPGARRLALSSPRLSAPLLLSLAEAEIVPEITLAARLVEKNDLQGAEKVLDGAAPSSSYSKVALTRLRARVARRKGDEARAESLFREAASLASASGRLSDEIENRLSLAHQAIVYRGDHAAADAEIRAVASLLAECPPWRVDGAYYRGVLAKERGRYSEALAAFSEARRTSERIGLVDMEAAVLQPLAGLLSIFGRDAEAIELLRRAHELASNTRCERGTALTNLAWAEHRAAGSKEAHERAAARAVEALRSIENASCGHVLATAQVNAALLQAAAGRVREARRGLEELRTTSHGDARLAPWLVRLELDVDRAEDPARALATAARLEQASSRDRAPEIAFEAALGRAEALDALDRTEDAAAAYREAARREMEWAVAAPLGEGRTSFFERQRSAFRAWVDFAVRRAERRGGAVADLPRALEVAEIVRWSLGRFAATLVAGPVASPRASSSPPRAGEVHLYYHPVREGWIGIAVSSTTGHMTRFDAPRGASGRAMASSLLGPFEALLAGASRVVVFLDRALREVAFQDLPFGAGVLSDHAAVAYGVGVPVRAEGAPADPSGCAFRPSLVLVLDPSRNLAGARRTGERLAAQLGAAARVLEGKGASREAVITALSDPCTRLFQYDGHAVFGGKDGVDAALQLADAPLTARDLLDSTVVNGVPDTVVLSGCETGREEGLGVANAFLQRGARQVLATTAPVNDALSAQLVEALHRQAPGAPTGAWDLPGALQAAVIALRGRGAGAGPWRPFRVLVP